MGKTRDAIELLRKMEKGGARPNLIMYNMVVDGLCKEGLVCEACGLCSEMVGKGILIVINGQCIISYVFF